MRKKLYRRIFDEAMSDAWRVEEVIVLSASLTRLSGHWVVVIMKGPHIAAFD